MTERNWNFNWPIGNHTVKVITATSTGAGQTDCVLSPAEGEMWIVDFAEGYHNDDAAARVPSWIINDSNVSTEIWTSAAIAQFVVQQFYNDTKWAHPLVLYAPDILQFTCAAVAVGHVVVIKASVRVVKGIPNTWSKA